MKSLFVLLPALLAGCATVDPSPRGPQSMDVVGRDADGRDAYWVRCSFAPNEFQSNEFRVHCPYTPRDVRNLERAKGACPPKRHWVCCAARHVARHREACEPNCQSRDYWPLLDDVAAACGGSDVQEGGNTLLVELWEDAG